MPPAPDETLHLLQRWHGGDRVALADLVERDRAWVEQSIRKRRGAALQQLGETHDDVQDLMVKALQYSPKFLCANRLQFRALLVRMIQNLLIDKARGVAARSLDRLEALQDSRLSLDPALVVATRPDEVAAKHEELAWMQLGLEFLDADDRDLIRRRQFQEQPFEVIGQALGAQANTVRMRFQRALLRLAGVVQRLQKGELERLLGESGSD